MWVLGLRSLQVKGQSPGGACPVTSTSKARRFYGVCSKSNSGVAGAGFPFFQGSQVAVRGVIHRLFGVCLVHLLI